MKTTYTITEAQAKLPKLVRETADGTIYSITRHGETEAYLISRDRMMSILETLEIMANPKAMKAIRAHRSGKMKFLPVEALDEI